MKMSGARAIVECLREQGVDTVFGYPGGTILPLYDALCDSPVRHILTVHEQGAAHAADGYARASGRVGVCIATSGPGATNLVTGLAAAFMDSIPMVAITGQVPTTLIGRDAFQEIDITGITMAVTKHNFLVKDPAKLADTIRYAFRIARSGRPGPVLIDVPRDVQTSDVFFEPAPPPEKVPWAIPGQVLSRIEAAAGAISAAKRPVIITGGGAISAEAQNQVRQLAEKLNIPVVSTLMGLGSFPASHPQFLGLTGLHGLKPANNAVYEADVIIAVGSRFSDRVTGDRAGYAAGKTVIHIDVDPAEIDKNVAAHIGLTGDMKTILGFLLERLTPGGDAAWGAKVRQWQLEHDVEYATDRLTAPWIFSQIAEQTAGMPCIFVTDVGQHQMWAAQHLKIEKPRTWITSGGLGAMGFGLPAALGAQLAEPQKRVIAIAGDGGFKMTGAELFTIASHQLPVILVIINNQGLGMIRQLQKVFFANRYTACELPQQTDFTLFAAAFGVHATAAGSWQEFAQAFATALASPQPEVIVANVAAEDMVSPMTPPGGAINAYIDI
ncbi:MAG: biosynthetic-type acetolactate synthase large subunit [Negativicutes bacterium]|nr:biosynthetic-type acetolactate synthase large subunit [Negativicutes bacterium]